MDVPKKTFRLKIYACVALALATRVATPQPAQRAQLIPQIGQSGPLSSVALSTDGHLVLTADGMTTLLWGAESGRLLRRFEGDHGLITCATLSADGRTVLTGGFDGMMRLWDIATGKELSRFKGAFLTMGSAQVGAAIWSIAYSPDGHFILTGSMDRSARLWNVATGTELRIFEGHDADVTSVAFSPDGRKILTGSNDYTARLWDVASGKELHRLVGHTGIVNSVAFSPNGKTVLTGGG